jgi:hypothetical protein
MWRILRTDVYDRQAKWYAKKKKNEFKAVLDNLDTLVKSLHSGKRPKPFAYGFLHEEPSDIIAIDQRGADAKVAATRLYVYPDIETDTLYLLTVGDKSSQGNDIQDCKRFVKQIKASPDCGGDEDDGYDEEDDSGDGAEAGKG